MLQSNNYNTIILLSDTKVCVENSKFYSIAICDTMQFTTDSGHTITVENQVDKYAVVYKP
jgi:hypothetical protein